MKRGVCFFKAMIFLFEHTHSICHLDVWVRGKSEKFMKTVFSGLYDSLDAFLYLGIRLIIFRPKRESILEVAF